MSEMLQRSVSLGSRRAPDPVDQFLEQHLLYRKHTAADACSLFRVIAEQVYDTQMLHYEVRMECIRYMFRKRRSFGRLVSGDYDEYLWQLERTRTEGTLLELRALCHLYRRNVIIHQPFDLGHLVVYNRGYPETLRIFVNPQGHFDSVMTMSELQMAAVCQAVSFKLLYRQLFRLPDLNLAVEWMLYPQTFECGTDLEFDRRGNVIRLLCRNGRSFLLDRSNGTLCILANYKDCPFHNRRLNLDQESQSMSCMRLLLQQNRPPFCYMAAKSLDPYIYRNVELTSLNVDRREAKSLNLYAGDYNFKVGAKCQVEFEVNRPLGTCHIQAISKDKSFCRVFIEGRGELKEVPFKKLHPLPPNEFKPWSSVPKWRAKRNGRLHARRLKRQMPKLQANRQKNQRQNIKEAAPGAKKEYANQASPPAPPVQGHQKESMPDQKPAMAPPPINHFSTPPPMAIPRQVYLQAPPPHFGPPGMLQHNQFQPHQMMIPPQGPLFYVTQHDPPTGMMPLPYYYANNPNPHPA
nr:protein ovarian tumor locus [Drosophila takahashii]